MKETLSVSRHGNLLFYQNTGRCLYWCYTAYNAMIDKLGSGGYCVILSEDERMILCLKRVCKALKKDSIDVH